MSRGSGLATIALVILLSGPGHAQRAGQLQPAIRIEPTELSGLAVEIEDDGGRAMRSFHDALARTARQTPDALTRIAHYGDSNIATDMITHTVRRQLQTRFGDGGHGFVLIARAGMPYLHRDVLHEASDGWEPRSIVRAMESTGLYGYGGVQFRARIGATATFATDSRGPVGGRVARFEVFYQEHPQGGRIEASIDAAAPIVIDTAGSLGNGFHALDTTDGPHTLRLRASGHGQVRLYGVAMERSTGVVYDSLGLVGARARRLLRYNAEHLAAQVNHRNPDLLILGFGGNEADDGPGAIGRYENEFAQVIDHVRGGRRSMACLVVAPMDQARRDEQGDPEGLATVPLIVEAQRRAARRSGCAFFDTLRAMGGPGAIIRWARGRPPLAVPDYRHATPVGYEQIGNFLYQAMLKSFADYTNR